MCIRDSSVLVKCLRFLIRLFFRDYWMVQLLSARRFIDLSVYCTVASRLETALFCYDNNNNNNNDNSSKGSAAMREVVMKHFNYERFSRRKATTLSLYELQDLDTFRRAVKEAVEACLDHEEAQQNVATSFLTKLDKERGLRRSLVLSETLAQVLARGYQGYGEGTDDIEANSVSWFGARIKYLVNWCLNLRKVDEFNEVLKQSLSLIHI
eukprot:TRINITY_DN22295_c0_g1_i1.p1 TRINITY_DN22295_c0_g1~~TRINITY_DN22295_c0_g1_i1.p1  ORF type:complete len:230 (+),score=43.55 TRINITY_DN22295_c0_g1_i1:61-690(+)